MTSFVNEKIPGESATEKVPNIGGGMGINPGIELVPEGKRYQSDGRQTFR